MTAPEQNYDEKLLGQEVVAAERAVLQALCQGTESGLVGDDGLRLLVAYRFRDTTHQVVFDVLRQIPSGNPEAIRRHLQQRLVLAGFPDLDPQEFFVPHGMDHQQVLQLIRRLAESVQET